jgi:hypothetical protein
MKLPASGTNPSMQQLASSNSSTSLEWARISRTIFASRVHISSRKTTPPLIFFDKTQHILHSNSSFGSMANTRYMTILVVRKLSRLGSKLFAMTRTFVPSLRQSWVPQNTPQISKSGCLMTLFPNSKSSSVMVTPVSRDNLLLAPHCTEKAPSPSLP